MEKEKQIQELTKELYADLRTGRGFKKNTAAYKRYQDRIQQIKKQIKKLEGENNAE